MCMFIPLFPQSTCQGLARELFLDQKAGEFHGKSRANPPNLWWFITVVGKLWGLGAEGGSFHGTFEQGGLVRIRGSKMQ